MELSAFVQCDVNRTDRHACDSFPRLESGVVMPARPNDRGEYHARFSRGSSNVHGMLVQPPEARRT